MIKKNFKFLASKLDNLPAVRARIERLWGTQACRKFIDSVMTGDELPRGSLGFDELAALIHLKSLHDETFPAVTPREDIWGYAIR